MDMGQKRIPYKLDGKVLKIKHLTSPSEVLWFENEPLYVYVHISIYTHIYIYMYDIYIYIYLYVYVYVCICLCMYIYICIYICLYLYIYDMSMLYIYTHIMIPIDLTDGKLPLRPSNRAPPKGPHLSSWAQVPPASLVSNG